jgi:hypothetical protein
MTGGFGFNFLSKSNIKVMKRLRIILVGVMFFAASCEKTSDSITNNLSKNADEASLEIPLNYISYEKNLRSETQKHDVEITNGIIHFKSPEVFKEISLKENEVPQSFLKAYPSFDSKHDKYIRFLSESEKLTSKEEALILLKKYKNSVEIIEDEIDIADLTFYDSFIPSTEQPYFYIGNTINVLTKGQHYVIIDGDENKIARIMNGESNLGNVVKKIFNSTTKKSRTTNSLCMGLYGEFYHNNLRGTSECIGETVGEIIGVVNGQTQFLMSARTWTIGEVKRKRFGIWWSYNTDKQLTLNHTVYMYVNGVQTVVQPIQAVFNSNGIGGIQILTTFTPETPIYLLGSDSPFTMNIQNNSNPWGGLTTSSISGVNIKHMCP